jgi:biopolymer transport protein ExbD
VGVGAARSVRVDGALVPVEGLARELRAKLGRKPDLVVHIAVDPKAPYATLVETLDQVKLSGARQVSLQSGGES